VQYPLQAYLLIHGEYIPEMITNYELLLCAQSIYTPICIANISYLSFERHECAKNTKERYADLHNMMLIWQVAGWGGPWHSMHGLVTNTLHKACKDVPWEMFQRKFIIMGAQSQISETMNSEFVIMERYVCACAHMHIIPLWASIKCLKYPMISWLL